MIKLGYPPLVNPGWGVATDFSSINLREDFIGHSRSISLNCGDLGWNVTPNTGGSIAGSDGSWPHLGIVHLSSGASNGGVVVMALNTAGATAGFGELGLNAGWEAAWVFRLNNTVSIKTFFGFSDHSSNFASTNMMKITYDTSVGNTSFRFVNRKAGVETNIDSGIAADTNWHTFRMSSIRPSEIIYQLDSNPAIVLTDNVPIVSLNALMMHSNGPAATVTMDWDAFAFSVQGLNR